ncbi:GNAT family N-acetyltransferase [Parasedimentitalea maritima]|uniref:GNAT family N-acetyltransferase n=1 Tax=Parasedimentitalea maritima TaxID=2578117 RepID=A0A6A4RHJ1_9RHOB|nr:GNAT family N-acetyltransferase [Zongyanglinia marina]KAE9630581.1 GNAT family N-acetyltransferase [Zongyanglinia marina]
MTAAPRPSMVATDLRVESAETLDQFRNLQTAWQDLEGRDPEGTVYLSWDWLAPIFAANPGRWRVLTVWHSQKLVCVFPMKLRVHWSTTRLELQTEIEAAGRLNYSEYTGFLCDPAHQGIALSVLAMHVKSLPWVRLSLKYEDSQARAATFMDAFSDAEFSSRNKGYVINDGSTDNLVCPRVALPASFDAYLDGLGKNMRQKMRRFVRKYLDSGALRLIWADQGDADAGIEQLLQHWMIKWSPSKGKANARKAVHTYRKMLMQAADQGLLRMPMLWQDEHCLGALGHVVDPRHKRIHFIVAGRDETVAGNFVGPLLHAQSVRWGIENGYRSYDLCHGNEPYKFTYGAVATRVNFFSIRRRNLSQSDTVLDPKSAPQALNRLIGFLEQNQQENALIAANQLQQVIG